MNRKRFLQRVSIITGGVILSNLTGCRPSQKVEMKNESLSNWAGNLQYSTNNVYYPKTVEEVQEVVKRCKKIKALGSKHSFNTIANSKDNFLSLGDLNKVVSLDKANNTITVESGTRYGDFAPYLDQHGFALENLASLPHITVAGACATGTHGSGVQHGNLSTQVAAIEFVNAKGDIIQLSKKDGDNFYGAIVNLGAIGIVTKVTLNIIPTFRMKQVVYMNMPMSALKDHFADVESKGYSVSLFTTWADKNINEVWVKSIANDNDTSAPQELFGATLATKNMHPVQEQSAENTTDQMGVPGTWYERMPHFKMGFKPSTGKELQAEFFVPIEHAYDAIMAVETLNRKNNTASFYYRDQNH